MSDIVILEYNERMEQKWNKVVEKSQNSNLSHLIEWRAIFSKVYGYESMYFLLEKDNETLAAFPSFIVDSLLFGKRILSVPIMEYGGLAYRYFDEEAFELLLDRIIEKGKVERAGYVEVRFPSISLEPLLKKLGFKLNRSYDYCTFIIDLQLNEQSLWKNLDKSSSRWGVKKARKSGVEIEEGRDLSDLENFYCLYLKTLKKHGNPPEPYDYFKEVHRSFYPERFRFWFAILDRQKIASSLYFLDKNTMYWAYSVSDEKYLKYNASNLLLWHAIEWGHIKGYKKFIMGRTRRGSRVYDFKKRWGGELVSLPVYCYLINDSSLPALDPEKGKYRILTLLWSKLPMNIARSVGPKIRAWIG